MDFDEDIICCTHTDEDIFDLFGNYCYEGDLYICMECFRRLGHQKKDIDEYACVPLHYVCMHPIVHPTELLTFLADGVDINIQDIHGNTPLHLIAYEFSESSNGGMNSYLFYWKKDTLTFLLEKGADLYMKNAKGITPYDILKRTYKHPIRPSCGMTSEDVLRLAENISTSVDMKEPSVD
jgi:hypothetical protein